MAITPIIFYVLGIVFIVLTLEEEGRMPHGAIYAGLGIFVNIIGYNISYQTADYVGLAYLPLAMSAVLVLMLLYQGYKSIPKGGDSWEKENDEFKTES